MVRGLLVLGGVLFIASRPERIDPLAVAADVVLIAALAPLGWAMLRNARTAVGSSRPREA